LAVSLLLSPRSQAQKVAQYSVGKEGTKDYEEIDFWTENDRRGRIEYSYGGRVALDKSEGPVKNKLSLSMHGHRHVRQRS